MLEHSDVLFSTSSVEKKKAATTGWSLTDDCGAWESAGMMYELIAYL